ncbi:MAG: GAF domain-containing protein [Candidatus Nanohaloarchaea archaeon]|nr:GAF domain-containing protein [Candidatus Nanohaloarchaea archaeon]
MDGTVYTLVVDSDRDRRAVTVEALQQRDWLDVVPAGTVQQAHQYIRQEDVDCVVSERHLSDGDARTVFQEAAEEHPETVRIMFSSGNGGADGEIYEVSESFYYLFLDREREDAYQRLTTSIKQGYMKNLYAPYPVPEREEKRLRALLRLRIGPDPALDRLTEEARDEFGVDNVSIRVMEHDRQRYLSTQGFEMEELERDKAICNYTLVQEDVREFRDVQEDPRFRDVPEFEELGINWYAGAVIRANNGAKIGTFCLEDAENQAFGKKERERLEEYADMAGALIELLNAQRKRKCNCL